MKAVTVAAMRSEVATVEAVVVVEKAMAVVEGQALMVVVETGVVDGGVSRVVKRSWSRQVVVLEGVVEAGLSRRGWSTAVRLWWSRRWSRAVGRWWSRRWW